MLLKRIKDGMDRELGGDYFFLNIGIFRETRVLKENDKVSIIKNRFIILAELLSHNHRRSRFFSFSSSVWKEEKIYLFWSHTSYSD